MKVEIIDDNFDILVKEMGKENRQLNANTEIFDLLSDVENTLLLALDNANKINNNYVRNAVAYSGMRFYTPKVSFILNGVEVSANNSSYIAPHSLENLPTSKQIDAYTKELIKIVSNSSPVTIYDVTKERDIVYACIQHFAYYGYLVTRCKNCGKWFIPRTKKSTKFCYRNDAKYTNMSCSDAFKYKERLMKLKNDDVLKTYNNTYNTLFNRVVRGNNEEIIKDAETTFNKFKLENAKKKELYNNNEISKDDYIKWLKSFAINKKD